MKVIIAGTRHCNRMDLIITAMSVFVEERGNPTEIVCGGARGADALGKRWAEMKGLPVTTFNADWNTYGTAAGPIRNREMAGYADALVAIWDGKSYGTKNMIDTMKSNLKPVVVQYYSPIPVSKTWWGK